MDKIIIICSIFIIIFYFFKKSQWIVLYESNNMDKSCIYEYLFYLKNNNIRCKVNMLNSRGFGNSMGNSFNVRNQETIQLRVHKNDYEKARKLISKKNAL